MNNYIIGLIIAGIGGALIGVLLFPVFGWWVLPLGTIYGLLVRYVQVRWYPDPDDLE